MTQRTAPISRKTNETQIDGFVNIDGKGQAKINTPNGLLTHMLELFSFHGYFDLELSVKGDTHIDIHHTNEDIGIALGKAFSKALGEERAGIRRFGSAFAPMESTVGHTIIDINGRGHLRLTLEGKTAGDMPVVSNQGEYSFSYLEHFLESFAKQLGATIIVSVDNPGGSGDMHSIAESVFKSLGIALDIATTIDPRRLGQIPSTKGIID
ncbi:MAG: imidazoleglycerol-phosphate dehydratase [Candidatus Omnitrophica bacterium]|nr:imidazoleglycerol-phosphate dehydratase [Candidatus Omnitrophota bacterium]